MVRNSVTRCSWLRWDSRGREETRESRRTPAAGLCSATPASPLPFPSSLSGRVPAQKFLDMDPGLTLAAACLSRLQPVYIAGDL